MNSNSVTRRRMLHAATILPAAAVKGTAANSAVSVGLLGCGNRGTYLGQTLTEHTTARLVALCDLYPDAIAKARQKIGRSEFQVFQDLQKMLASPIDAVIIATPVFLHPEHFEAAAQAAKHVYLEKPAAPDVEGCQRIERAAAKVSADRDIGFGLQRRHGVTYTSAYQLLKSGKIGPIQMLKGRFMKSGGMARGSNTPPKTMEEKIKAWYNWRALCGDLIVENNVHVIDVMNWFAGARPEAASGEGGQKFRAAGDVRDHGSIIYQYPNKVLGDFTGATICPPFYREVREEFYGTTGWLETSENGWRYRLSAKESFEDKAPHNVSIDSVKMFVNRIQSGKVENTIARGVESTLTAILGRLAMDLHRPVTWKEMLSSNGWPA